jgi:hypothetical protein
MSLRSNGEAKGLRSNSKIHKNKGRLRDATLSAVERLEQRQLLNAQVSPTVNLQSLWNGSTPLNAQPGKTFWINGLGGSTNWIANSSITPNTVNDLLLNVTPFTQSYTGCCEGTNASPGNTGSVNAARLFTNGLTQNQVGGFPSSGQTSATGSGSGNDASSGQSVLSQNGGGNWFVAYNLGAWPGGSPNGAGYDISEIDVISGHQDYRTGISVDILVQFVNGNSTDWFSLSNGRNFSFTSDSTRGNAQVSRGGAQMAILNNSSGPIASNVRSIKLFASNQQTWFREFVVNGTPDSTLPSTINPPPGPVVAALDPSTPGAVDITFSLPTQPPPVSGYSIQRALVTNGVVGSFTTINSFITTTSPQTFVDTTAAAGSVFVYQIVDFNPGASGTSPQSNFITTPNISAEAHFYNQAFWTGPVSASQGVVTVSADTGGAWPGTGANQDSSVWTGKVTTNASGVYSIRRLYLHQQYRRRRLPLRERRPGQLRSGWSRHPQRRPDRRRQRRTARHFPPDPAPGQYLLRLRAHGAQQRWRRRRPPGVGHPQQSGFVGDRAPDQPFAGLRYAGDTHSHRPDHRQRQLRQLHLLGG